MGRPCHPLTFDAFSQAASFAGVPQRELGRFLGFLVAKERKKNRGTTRNARRHDFTWPKIPEVHQVCTGKVFSLPPIIMVQWKIVVSPILVSRWWQLKYFGNFLPDRWGNDPNWRAYFSDGLVQQPTSFTWPKMMVEKIYIFLGVACLNP